MEMLDPTTMSPTQVFKQENIPKMDKPSRRDQNYDRIRGNTIRRPRILPPKQKKGFGRITAGSALNEQQKKRRNEQKSNNKQTLGGYMKDFDHDFSKHSKDDLYNGIEFRKPRYEDDGIQDYFVAPERQQRNEYRKNEIMNRSGLFYYRKGSKRRPINVNLSNAPASYKSYRSGYRTGSQKMTHMRGICVLKKAQCRYFDRHSRKRCGNWTYINPYCNAHLKKKSAIVVKKYTSGIYPDPSKYLEYSGRDRVQKSRSYGKEHSGFGVYATDYINRGHNIIVYKTTGKNTSDSDKDPGKWISQLSRFYNEETSNFSACEKGIGVGGFINCVIDKEEANVEIVRSTSRDNPDDGIISNSTLIVVATKDITPGEELLRYINPDIAYQLIEDGFKETFTFRAQEPRIDTYQVIEGTQKMGRNIIDYKRRGGKGIELTEDEIDKEMERRENARDKKMSSIRKAQKKRWG